MAPICPADRIDLIGVDRICECPTFATGWLAAPRPARPLGDKGWFDEDGLLRLWSVKLTMPSEQRFVERLVAALGDHGCLRDASAEKRAALLRYAQHAIRLGAPFDDETLNGLVGLSPAQVDEAAADIAEKTSPEAREAITAPPVPDGDRTWVHEALERVFGNADTVIESFLLNTQDLWSRVDAATAVSVVSAPHSDAC